MLSTVESVEWVKAANSFLRKSIFMIVCFPVQFWKILFAQKSYDIIQFMLKYEKDHGPQSHQFFIHGEHNNT